MPHILPCPAPRIEFADVEMTEDGQRRRRRRKPTSDESIEMRKENSETSGTAGEEALLARKAHQCPVPKPTGLIGQVLGFGSDRRDRER
jgi:cytochrome c oxidase assembly factor 2